MRPDQSGNVLPGRKVWALGNRLDEDRARRLRRAYGRQRWVLSWNKQASSWVARISGPGHDETVECGGRTRVEAIRRAARALILELDKAPSELGSRP